MAGELACALPERLHAQHCVQTQKRLEGPSGATEFQELYQQNVRVPLFLSAREHNL